MYQQQNQQQPSFVQSQYRGASMTQGRYQPTGYVQSFYQGATASPTLGGSYSSGLQSQSNSGQSGYMSTESYHAANYQGNQPGHDNDLRADSTNPSSYRSDFQSGYQGGFQSMGPSYGQTSQQGVYGSTGTYSYQTAEYRGNQPGHDQNLRADSTMPSSYGYTNASSIGMGSSSFGSIGSSIGQSMGTIGSGQFQSTPSPQSYHTAGYQGNQPGHDNDLRADSRQPSGIGQNQGQYGFR